MSPLSKRIENAQNELVRLRDQLNEHITKMDENPDDAATAVTDDLTTKIDSMEKSLAALQRAEVQLSRTIESRGSNLPALHNEDRSVDRNDDRGSEQLVPLRTNNRPFAAPGQKIRPADYIFRAIAMDLRHFGEERRRPILDIIKEEYGDGEHGELTRVIASRFITKAAAIPADTTTSGWASNFVQTVIGDFIQSLIPYSVYPMLSSKGGSFTYGRNGVVSLPARNTATTVSGAFIAQGAPIPVKQGAFTSITLTPKKMGVITTLTREITEHSTPSIEAIVRQALLEDTGVALDVILLDATAADTTRPAGLKNGVTKVTASTTASIVGFVADLKVLTAALITNTKGNLRAPVWIMNPGDVLAAQLLQTTTGDTPFRDEVSRGTLLGFPIIASTTGTFPASVRTMFLVDAADFITATGDTPNFSVSDQAVLHMEDTSPAAITTGGSTPAFSSPVRSLWQTDTMAIRMIMDVNWAMRRTGVVQWTDTMVW